MRIKTNRTLTLKEVAYLLGAEIAFDREINAICTDSRECHANDLFIALSGEKHNGADYIDDARKRGAFVIAEHGGDINTKRTDLSLLSLASKYKRIINPRYTVAVTGSVGKTTVKDFTHFLLSSVMPTHKTEGNYNNIIGVSHTLLSMPKNTEALVCELGMNHTGEIELLSRAVIPDIAIITNIGTAHIGNLGSRERIAEAKLEIQNGMTSNGRSIVSLEEPLLRNIKNPYFVSYRDKSSDLYAEIFSLSSKGCKVFIKTERFECEIESGLYSEHSINSLIYAVAVCDLLNMSPKEISDAAKIITSNCLRQKFISKYGYSIYDDSYNSSPEAVIADFNMLSKMGNNNSALLGDMLELGERSEEMHLMIGAECARFGFKKLYAFGKYCDSIAKGAIREGMNKDFVFTNSDLSKPEATAKQIKESYSGETLLVKASHSIRADRIIKLLINKESENA